MRAYQTVPGGYDATQPDKVQMPDIINKESREWMTAAEVADYLKVEESTVKQWVKLKKIPHGKAGSLARFDRETIDAWVTANGSPESAAS